jgi:hypothetical protein
VRNALVATALALLVPPTLILVLFYGGIELFGGHHLVADLAMFVVAVFAGQAASARAQLHAPLGRFSATAAMAAIIAGLTCFTLFSYHAPEHELFRDPWTGGYGAPADVTETS